MSAPSLQEFRETTKPLLRPDQLAEMEDEKRRLQSVLDAPPYIASGVDRVEVGRQLRNLKKQLETQTPRPYEGGEKDAAVKRETELREEFTRGMPTQAEMRRSPAGAVDKHTQWERRNKAAILEWKNIRRRLFMGGDLSESAGEVDHANIEMYRPRSASHELDMYGEQIVGREYYLPPPGAALPVTMSQEQSDMLLRVDPKLHGKMTTLSNADRAEVLSQVDDLIAKEKNEK